MQSVGALRATIEVPSVTKLLLPFWGTPLLHSTMLHSTLLFVCLSHYVVALFSGFPSLSHKPFTLFCHVRFRGSVAFRPIGSVSFIETRTLFNKKPLVSSYILGHPVGSIGVRLADLVGEVSVFHMHPSAFSFNYFSPKSYKLIFHFFTMISDHGRRNDPGYDSTTSHLHSLVHCVYAPAQSRSDTDSCTCWLHAHNRSSGGILGSSCVFRLHIHGSGNTRLWSLRTSTICSSTPTSMADKWCPPILLCLTFIGGGAWNRSQLGRLCISY